MVNLNRIVNKILLVIPFVLLYQIEANATIACYGIFSGNEAEISKQKESTIISKSSLPKIEIIANPSNKRVELQKTLAGDLSRLDITRLDFNSHTMDGLVELLRASLNTTDSVVNKKTTFGKNKFSLGFEIGSGYFLLASFKSNSTRSIQFVLSDVDLITPSGNIKRVAKDLTDDLSAEIKQTEFELSDGFPAGYKVNAKLPFVLDGQVLALYSKYSEYFKYFEKDELRNLFQKSSSAKILWTMRFKKIKYLLSEIIIKQPLKFMVGGIVAFSFINSGSHLVKSINKEAKSAFIYQSEGDYSNNYFNGRAFPAGRSDLSIELDKLKSYVAEQSAKQTAKDNNKKKPSMNLPELISEAKVTALDPFIMFFTKEDSINHSIHTYVAIANESLNGQQITYNILEIDAFKFQNLIQFAENQK